MIRFSALFLRQPKRPPVTVDWDVLPNLLTIAQTAKLLHVHPNTLRQWDQHGKLRAERIGSRRDRRYRKELIRARQIELSERVPLFLPARLHSDWRKFPRWTPPAVVTIGALLIVALVIPQVGQAGIASSITEVLQPTCHGWTVPADHSAVAQYSSADQSVRANQGTAVGSLDSVNSTLTCGQWSGSTQTSQRPTAWRFVVNLNVQAPANSTDSLSIAYSVDGQTWTTEKILSLADTPSARLVLDLPVKLWAQRQNLRLRLLPDINLEKGRTMISLASAALLVDSSKVMSPQQNASAARQRQANLNRLVEVSKQLYQRAEQPVVVLPKQSTKRILFIPIATTTWHLEQVNLVDQAGVSRPARYSIHDVAQGGDQSMSLSLDTRDLHPGRYRLNISMSDTSGVSSTVTKDFLWGVTALNTDHAVTKPGDLQVIGMGVLDDAGRTICDADMTLTVTDPKGGLKHFSTKTKTIASSGVCIDRGVTNLADYVVKMPVTLSGLYHLHMEAETSAGLRVAEETFQSDPTISFDVDRFDFPTRIYPLAPYTVRLAVTPAQNFRGVVREQLPSLFKISNLLPTGTIIPLTTPGNQEEIDWTVDWQKGITYFLSYQFDAPDISPALFSVGPLTLGGDALRGADFAEPRQWQIASDTIVRKTKDQIAFTPIQEDPNDWKVSQSALISIEKPIYSADDQVAVKLWTKGFIVPGSAEPQTVKSFTISAPNGPSTGFDEADDLVKQGNLERTVAYLVPNNRLRPGKYTVTATLADDTTLTQTFEWGTLDVSAPTGKHYALDRLDLTVASTDHKGSTDCATPLVLDVTAPSGKDMSYRTDNGTIVAPDSCQLTTAANTDTYTVPTVPEESGSYHLKLTRTVNGQNLYSEREIMITGRDKTPDNVKQDIQDAVRTTKKLYRASENPIVQVDTETSSGPFGMNKTKRQITAIKLIDPSTKAELVDPTTTNTTQGSTVTTNVAFDPTILHKPGKYTTEVTVVQDGYAQQITQDFTWGVLDVNVRRSYSHSHSDIQIAMSVLDDIGKTICDASVQLDVTDPQGKIQHFTTEDTSVAIDPGCVDRRVTNDPDYAVHYTTGGPGQYVTKVTATNANGTRSITDSFQVDDNQAFDVERTAFPSRIYPIPVYPVSFTITAKQDYSGPVIETVPDSFILSDISDAGVVTSPDEHHQQMTWSVHWKAGETHTLGYSIKFPNKAPEFYVLGPLQIGTFKEARQWQVASDSNACTLTYTAAASWTTAAWASCTGTNGNWPGSTTAGDTATITNNTTGSTLTLNTNLINSSLALGGLTMNSSAVAMTLALGANTLFVNGTVTINQPSAAVTESLTMTSGGLTIQNSNNLAVAGTTTTASTVATVTVTTGLLDVGGSITYGATASMPAANKVVSLNNSGTIRIRGAETLNCGTLRNQTTAGTLQLDSLITIGSATCASAATFTTIASSTVKLGNGLTTTASSTPTVTFNATSLADFTGSGTITPSAGTLTLGKVQIDSGAVVTLAAGVTVAGTGTTAFVNNNTTGSWTGAFTTTFSGAAPTVVGNTTFSTLTSSAAATDFTVGASTTVTVTNNYTDTQGGGGVTKLDLNTNSGAVLSVGGTATFFGSSALGTNTYNVGQGTLTVTGKIISNITATSARIMSLNVATGGTVNANGGIDTTGTGAATAGNSIISMTGGTGTFNLKGAISVNGTACTTTCTSWTFTMGTSGANFVYADSAAQTVVMPAAGAYNNLVINNTNASGATLAVSITTSNVTGNLTVGDNSNTAAIFNDATGLAIAGGAFTFTVKNSATFNMPGTSTYPTGFTTFTYGATSTVNFKQTTAGLTLPAPASPGFGNLGMVAAASVTQNFPAATLNVQGNLTIGDGSANVTTAAASGSNAINVGGNWLVAANSVYTKATETVSFTGGSTGNYTIDNRASQFNSVTINQSGSTWKPNTNSLTIAGDLTITAGSLYGNGALNVTVNGNIACGASCGTIDMTQNTGSGTFTQSVATGKNFGTSVTADTTAWSFVNLTLTSSAGSNTITTSTTPTAPGNITVTTLLTISASTTLSNGNSARTWVLSGNSGTTFTLTGTLSGTGRLTYQNSATNFPTGGTLGATPIIRFDTLNGNMNIPARTDYGAIEAFGGSANARTITLGTAGSQTITTSSYFYIIANAASPNHVTLQGATWDPALNVGGDFDFTGTGSANEIVTAPDAAATWTVSGNVDFTSGTYTTSAETLVMNGASKSLTTNSNGLNNVTFSGTGTTTLADSLSAAGNVILNSTISAGSTTLTMTGSAKNLTGGSATVNNLTLSDSTTLITSDLTIAGTLNVADAKTFTMTSRTVTLSGNSGSTLNLNTSGTVTGGTLIFQNSAGTALTTGGTISSAFTFDLVNGNETIPNRTFSGAVVGKNGTTSARSLIFDTSVTPTFSSGLDLQQSNATGTLLLDGATNNPTTVTVTGNFTTSVATGAVTVSMGSGNWNVSGNFDLSNVTTFNNNSGTLTMNGTGTLTSNSKTLNNFTTSGGGTITLASATHTLAGNLSLGSTGLTAGTSTVTMTGSSKTIDGGSLSLYNLIISGSETLQNTDLTVSNNLQVDNTKSITFNSGRTLTLSNSGASALTLNGTLNGPGRVIYRSSTAFPTTGTLGAVLILRYDLVSNAMTTAIRTDYGSIEAFNSSSTNRILTIGNGTHTLSGNFDMQTTGTGTLTVAGDTNNVAVNATGNVTASTANGAITFSMGSNTWTVGGSFNLTNVTTFNNNSGVLAMNGTGTLTSNGKTLNNVTLSGAITLANATHTVAGNLNLTSSTITAGTSTVVMTGTSKTIDGGAQTLATLQISGTATLQNTDLTVSTALTVDSAKSLTINNVARTLTLSGDSGTTLTMTGGTINGPGKLTYQNHATTFPTDGTLASTLITRFDTVNGNMVIPARTDYGAIEAFGGSANARTVTLGTAGSQTITTSTYFYVIANAASPNHVTLQGATWDPILNIGGDFDFTGTGGANEIVTAPDAAATWTVSGNVDLTSGTWTTSAETLVMNGASKTLTTAGNGLNNVTFSGTGTTTLADNLSAAGNVTLNSTISAGSTTLSMTGSSKNLVGGTATLSGLTISDNTSLITSNLTVSGTLTVASSKTLTVTTVTLTDTGGDISWGNGSSTISGTGLLTFTDASGGPGTGGTLSVPVRFDASAANVANTTFDGRTYGGATELYSNAATGKSISTVGSGTYTFSSTLTVTSAGAGATTLDMNTTDPTTFTTNGTLTVGSGSVVQATSSGTFNINANYINSGTFTHNSGTVTAAGSAQEDWSGTLSGSTGKFNNLTITNAFGDGSSTFSVTFAGNAETAATFTATTASTKLRFHATSTYTFQNISLNGQATGTRVFLRSSTSASAWLLNVAGTATVSNTNVKDSNASGSAAAIEAGTSSFDATGNTNWNFADYISVSGTIYQSGAEGSAFDCSGGNSISLHVSTNGGANKNGTCSAANGTFTISGAVAPTGADIPVAIFSDNASANKLTTVTLSSGTGSISGLTLIVSRVVVSQESATAMTNTLLNTADNGDVGIRYNVASGNLTTESGMELHVLAGKTFTPGGNVTTTSSSDATSIAGDVHIPATSTFALGTNALSIGGHLVNAGSLTSSAGSAITFTSTASGNMTIDTGGATIQDLTLNNASGHWTNSGNLTMAGNFTLTAGAFTQAANTTMTVNGTSFSLANGTTWTKTSGTGKLVFENSSGLSFADNNTAKQDLGAVQAGASPGITTLTTDFSATSLTIPTTDTFNTKGYEVTLTDFLDCQGSCVLDATDTAPNNEGDGTIFSVGGNFTLSSSSTITAATSTVTMTGASKNLDAGGKTLNHLTISGTATLTNTATAGGNLTIDNAKSLTMGNFAFTVTGTSSITGTLTTATGSTGTRTFTGAVTVNSGGTFDVSGQNPAVTFGGTITNNSTNQFKAGSGSLVLTTSQSIAGTGTFLFNQNPYTIPAGTTVTNNATGTVTFTALTLASASSAVALSLSTGSTTTVTNALNYTANAGGSNQTITMNGTANLNASSLTIPAMTAAGSSNITCAASATGTLTVTNGFAMTSSSTAAQTGKTTVDMLTCTLTAGTISITGGTVTAAELKASTGTITSVGAFTFAGTSGNTKITTSGAATVNSGGDFIPGCTCTFDSTSNFHFTANGRPGSYTYPNFFIDSGVTLNMVAGFTIAGNWTNNSTTPFTGGNQTIVFIGSSKTIGGSSLTPFYGMVLGNGSSYTLNTNATIGGGNLTWNPNNTATTFTQASGIDLNISGSVALTQPVNNQVISSWLINAGTAEVSGTITFSGGNTGNFINKIILTTGTLTMTASTSLSFASNATVADQVIDCSGGAATVKISGSITNPGSATSTPGSSGCKWVYNGSAAQTVYFTWGNAGAQYNDLQILNTNASGASPDAAPTATTLTGNLTVGDGSTSSVLFKNGSLNITGASGKTFEVKNLATFQMDGTTQTFPTGFTTYTFGSTSTTTYKQTSAQNVSTQNYGTLNLTPAGTVTYTGQSGAFGVQGSLTVGNGTNALTFTNVTNDPTITVTSTMTIAASAIFVASDANSLTVGGSFTNSGTFTSSGGTLVMNGTGTLTTGSSTLGNFTTSGIGTVTLANATHTITGNLTLGSVGLTAGTSTVVMNGSSKTIDGGGLTLNNLTISGSETLQNTDLTVSSTLQVDNTNSITLNSSRTLTLSNTGASALTLNGTINGPGRLIYRSSTAFPTTGTLAAVLILRYDMVTNAMTSAVRTDYGSIEAFNSSSSSRTLTIGNGTHTLSGYFDMQTTGSGAMIVATDTNNPAVNVTTNVTASTASGAITLSMGSNTWTVGGNFDLTNVTTLNHNSGTLALNGTGTLTSNGKTLNNVTTSGSGAITLASATHTLAGNLTLGSSATITAGTSTIAMTGSSKTIDGGGQTLYNLTISGSETLQNTDLTASNTLQVDNTKSITLNSGRTLTLSNTGASALTLNGTINGPGKLIYRSSTAFPTTGTLAAVLILRYDMVTNAMTSAVRTDYGSIEVLNTSSSSRTFTLGNGTHTLSGYFDMQTTGSGAMIIAGNTNNPAVNVTGNVTASTANGAITLSMGSNTWTVGGNFDLTNVTTFNHNSGTLAMNGTGTLTSNGKTLNNFTTSGGGTITLASATHTLAGNLNIGSTGLTAGTSTVVMTGSTKTIDGGGKTLSALTISDDTTLQNTDLTVSGTLQIDSPKTLTINVNRTLTHSGATLTLNGTITGSGTYVYQSSTTFPTSGTISSHLRFDATNNNQTASARTYGGQVEFYNNSASTLRTVTLGTAGSQTLTFSSHFYLNANGAADVTVDGSAQNPTINITGDLDYTGTGSGEEVLVAGSGTWTVSGNVDFTSGFYAPQVKVINPAWDRTVFQDMHFDDAGLGCDLQSTIYSCQGASGASLEVAHVTGGDCVSNYPYDEDTYKSAMRFSLSTAFSGLGSSTITSSQLMVNVSTAASGQVLIGRTNVDSIDASSCSSGAPGGMYARQGVSQTYATATDWTSTGRKYYQLGATATSDVKSRIAGDITVATNYINDVDQFFDSSEGTVPPVMRVGYVSAGTPTLVMNGSSKTLTTDSNALYNLTLSGTITLANATHIIAGNLDMTGGTITAGSSTVLMEGTAATITGGNATLSGLNIDPESTGTVTLSGSDLTASGTVTVATGDTLSLGASRTLTHSGSTLNLNGTISGSGTLVYQSTTAFPTTGTISSPLRFDATGGNQTMSNRTYGGNVEIYNNSGSSARTVTMLSSTHTLSGTLTITANNSQNVTLAGATNNPTVNLTGDFAFSKPSSGTPTMTMGSGTWTMSGNVDLTNGTVTAGTSTLTMDGTSKNLTGGSATLSSLTIGGTISLATSDLTVGTTLTVNNTKTLTLNASRTLTLSGTSGTTLSLSGTIGGNTGTLNYQNTGTAFPTTGTVNSIVRFDTVSGNVTMSNRTYGGDVEIYGNTANVRSVTMSAGTHNLSANLKIITGASQSQILTLSGSNNPVVNLTGNLTYTKGGSATPAITTGTGAWTVSGNFDASNGTFTPTTNNTLTLNGSSQQTVSGSPTFYNLTITNSSGSDPDSSPSVILASGLTTNNTFTAATNDVKLRFNAGSTYTLTAINFSGTSGHFVTLHSSAGGSQWHINAGSGSRTITFASVKDSEACSSTGGVIDASDGTNKNEGDNDCWTFAKLTVSLSGNSVAFGTLTTGQVYQGSISSTVTTTGSGGYVSVVSYDHTLQSGANTIADTTGSPPNNMSAGTSGFGASTSQAGNTIAQWNPTSCATTASASSATPLSTSAKSFASSSGTVSGQATTLCLLTALSGTQVPGAYTSNLTVVTTGRF